MMKGHKQLGLMLCAAAAFCCCPVLLLLRLPAGWRQGVQQCARQRLAVVGVQREQRRHWWHRDEPVAGPQLGKDQLDGRAPGLAAVVHALKTLGLVCSP